MSPEQAKGARPIGGVTSGRSARCSTRCSSGERAFKGEDVAETLAAVAARRYRLVAAAGHRRRRRATAAGALPRSRRRAAAARYRRSTHRAGRSRLARTAIRHAALASTGRRAGESRSSCRPRGGRRPAASVARSPVAGPASSVAPSITRFALSMPRRRTLLSIRSLAISRSRRTARTSIYKGGAASTDAAVRPRARSARARAADARRVCRKGRSSRPTAMGRLLRAGRTGCGAQEGRDHRRAAVDVSRLDGPSRGATWGDDDTIIAASGAPSTGLLRMSPAGGDAAVLTRPNRERGEARSSLAAVPARRPVGPVHHHRAHRAASTPRRWRCSTSRPAPGRR